MESGWDMSTRVSSAPVCDSSCVCTQTFRVRAGETRVDMSQPLSIRTFLQLATVESACRLNLGRDANPIHVQVVTVLPDGVVTARRKRGPQGATCKAFLLARNGG